MVAWKALSRIEPYLFYTDPYSFYIDPYHAVSFRIDPSPLVKGGNKAGNGDVYATNTAGGSRDKTWRKVISSIRIRIRIWSREKTWGEVFGGGSDTLTLANPTELPVQLLFRLQ